MMPVGLTQRISEISDYGEIRECLDAQWGEFLKRCDLMPIPLSHAIEIEEFIRFIRIGGIILTGGNNLSSVDPNNPLNRLRDDYERHLIEFALSRRIPVLGICRGMQMIVHYFGGRLVTIDNHVRTTHPVIFAKDSQHFTGYGKRHMANSFHDYAVADSGGHLLVSGISETDKTIESIEHPHRTLAGIMWHPERYEPFHPCDIRFFRDFFNNHRNSRDI